MTKRLRSDSSEDEFKRESGTQTSRDNSSNNSETDNKTSENEEIIITDGRRIVGQVKWFNVKKGWGFIIGENGEDIFVHQSGVNKSGFRSLDDGEMVEYEIRNTDKGPEACNITGPSGSSVMGSQRRKRMRILQKQRKNRCFNCNVEGHVASTCPVPNTTKRCHVCLKDDHLMRQCPHQPLLLAAQQEQLSPGLMSQVPPPMTSIAAMGSHHMRPGSAPSIPVPNVLSSPSPASASIIAQMQIQQQIQQQLLQQAQITPQQLLQSQQILQTQQMAQSPQLYYSVTGQPFVYTYLPRFPSGPPI